MLAKYKFIIITIITSIIIGNIFFFLNSRSFVSTFLMKPLSDNIFIESIRNGELKIQGERYKKIFNPPNGIYEEVTDNLKVDLYSNIIRFLQNNKSYKYELSKEYNFTKKQEKNYFSVVENINLEGAYFLNPKFLSIVKVQLFNNKKIDEEILKNYLGFIIKKELMRLDKISLQYSNELIKQTNEFKKKSENILKFINWSSFYFENLKPLDDTDAAEAIHEFYYNRSKTNIKNIRKDLIFLDKTLNKVQLNKNISLKDIEKFKMKLSNIIKFYQQEYLFFNKIFNYNDIDIRNLINDNAYYNLLYLISNNDWFIYNSNEITFDDKNFDFSKIEKKITKNLEYISRRFNTIELISINIFSIIFGISIYFIYFNFRSKFK